MHDTQPTVDRWSERKRVLTERLQRVRGVLSSPIMRRVWQALTVLSLVAALVSTIYLWEQLKTTGLEFAPWYLVIALAIYAITYTQRLLGWQATATYFFGRIPLRENAEAAAASTLLKFLPTVAWYIANRVHFYTRREISRRAVIAASLFELVAMTVSGAILYGVYWFAFHASWLTFLAVVAVCVSVLVLVRPSGALRTWWRERIVAHIVAPDRDGGQQRLLWIAFFWYGGSWIMSIAFFWAVCAVLVPVTTDIASPILDAWLLSNLVNNLLSFAPSTVPLAREVTLSVMLSTIWSWPVALAVVALVKLYFTFGEVVCSAVVLAWLYVKSKISHA